MEALAGRPKVLVAGATGMVGSAICRRLKGAGYDVVPHPTPRLDLRNQQAAHAFLLETGPDWVFLAAAKVGGILANSTYHADFIYDNLMIQTNVIHGAFLAGVKRLLFLGSSCIYPRLSPQPMKEEYLLSGYLEPTNEPYAVAKIAGIITARSYHRQFGCDFFSVMPTNLYGPNDNFDLANSHVIPALIRKAHEAKNAGPSHMEVWGSGTPRREFLHVDDLADACVFLMENYKGNDIVNIGTGIDVELSELVSLVKDVVGYSGEIVYNADMPDGMPRKLLDVSRIAALGWNPSIPLKQGLASTYEWFLENRDGLRT